MFNMNLEPQETGLEESAAEIIQLKEMMKETYVKRIWKRRPGRFFNTGKSILLMYSAKRHLGDEVEQVFTDVNSSIKIIHGGMTPLLQFLDTHVTNHLKTS